MAGMGDAHAFATLETMFRGVGQELASMLADQLREDAINSRLLGRSPAKWDDKTEDLRMWSLRIESFSRRLAA